MAKALTVKSIEAMKASTGRKEIPDGLLSGLYLVMQPSGARSWAVRYRSAGVPKKLTLGKYPAIDLLGARELAKTALRAVAEGRDPMREKQVTRQLVSGGADSVEAICKVFIERYAKKETRESTWRETERLFNREIIPAWGRRRIGDITKRDVIDLLDKITDRGSPIQANRTLAAVRKMFNWCLSKDKIVATPCAGLEAPSKERSRDRVLEDHELAALWKAADAEGFSFGLIVQMLLLTGQRRDEVAAMTWAEVDLEAKTWTIPPERAKNDELHDVPLSDMAVRLLQGVPRLSNRSGLVFSLNGDTPFNGFSRAKRRLDDAIEKIFEADGAAEEQSMPWTLHDLRRTVATRMAELGQPVHVTEAVLNHRSGTIKGVAAVYQRYKYSKEKRAALDAWASLLQSIVEGRAPNNVVSLNSARA